ncbi:AbrB/MazE/SpoVT family DNA-binding domain-containing protein [Thermococcus sp. JCM 11816]
MEVVKVSSKGQIVIPKSLREKLGIKEGGSIC